MSDEGEKTCPLCAEEMDLTDQQLKPCKCGYEICIWCWHHIMDMAEKDETEGRCPACRTPYNKEKIVGMAANCGRLVTEMNMERKLKSQKAKAKTSEGRKQLSSVRVIQRNLVYVVGLPLNLADENLLQQKEYFGQYGKVLKASISRTAAGAIQQFANNTCSVYITYSKEEEAVRCIQSVHGFVLEGRPLRACFGTTKYCHAWLRNMPCSNPDCLYLHEIGSQEDSFTKDEIISAYTRSRVQQFTGAPNHTQRHSGNVLPPPADDCFNNSSASLGKPIHKTSLNNPTSMVKGSPPKSGSGSSFALPASASWGTHVAICQMPSDSSECSNGPDKQKPDTCSGSLAFSMAVASSCQVSLLQADIGKKLIPNDESCTNQQKHNEAMESKKQYIGMDCLSTISETPATLGFPDTSTIDNRLYFPPESKDEDNIDLPNQSDKELDNIMDEKVQNLCSNISSMSITSHQGLQHCNDEQFREPFTPLTGVSPKDFYVTSQQLNTKSDMQTYLVDTTIGKVGDDLPFFDEQKLKDPEVLTQSGYLANSSNMLLNSRGDSPQHSKVNGLLDVGTNSLEDKAIVRGSLPRASSIQEVPNGFPKTAVSKSSSDSTADSSNLLSHQVKRKPAGGFEEAIVNVDHIAVADMGENSIISNILSMEFDPWDESLTSPQNLAKILGETDEVEGSVRKSSSWKIQNRHQSRFSFAREEESINQGFEPTLTKIGQAMNDRPFSHNFIENEENFLNRFGTNTGFSCINVEESDKFACSNSQFSINKLPAPKTQISAPPGFSVPGEVPPQDIMPHEKMEQPYHTNSENFLLDTSTSIRNQYRTPLARNIDITGDIEFMDPAILAVGKGRITASIDNPGLHVRSIPSQFTFENELRLQLLMQRSLSPHQSHRSFGMGDHFSQQNSIPSRIMEQTLENNLSTFSQLALPQLRNALISNGHLSEVHSENNFGMTELLGTERLRINEVYTSYEASNMQMPSLDDLQDGRFGI